MATKFDTDLEGSIKDIFNDLRDPTRKMQERLWFRNLLYMMGEQYIEWVVSLNTFRRKNSHPFTPTPVANIIRDYVKSTAALYLNRQFTIRVWPNSTDQGDRDAARLAENILRFGDADDDEKFLRESELVLYHTIALGTGFMRTFPYKRGGQYGMDYRGKITEMAEVGNQAVLSFNVYPDLLGQELEAKRYIGIKSLKPKEWVEDTFKTTIKSGEDDVKSVDYERRLLRMVSQSSPWKGMGLETQILDMKAEELCKFYEVEFAPTKSHPNGRYVQMVNDKLLKEHDHLPIPVKDGKWSYTLTDFHFNRIPGRFWSDSGINDLISPQNAINSIDQTLELNRKGLGRPVFWMPNGSTIKRMNKYGMAFLALEYDATAAGGQRPEIDRGVPLPNQFLEERSIHKETIQESAGDPKNILRGKPPSSKASGVMVDILRETAEASHSPSINDYYRSLRKVYRKRLILTQDIQPEERIIKIAGKGKSIFIQRFKGSDLRSNFDVRLEIDTKVSSSRAAQTETILRLVEQGFWPELQTDPETRTDIMKRLGIGSFQDRTNVDVERAERENAKIANKDFADIFLVETPKNENGEPMPGAEPIVVNDDPMFQFDDHFIHYEVHRRFILSPQFEALEEGQRIMMLAHTKIHEMLMKEQQAQQMAAQAMMEGKMQPEEGEK